MIVPIVLHRVVKSNCIDFEDITITSFKRIVSQDSNKYISVEDVSEEAIKSKEKYYLITFDDGYLSDYYLVYPILKQKNIRATFFINPSTVGSDGHVSWDMVREMKEHGMCIESHSYSHPDMTKITLDNAKQELINSKKAIAKEIKVDVFYFSFPFGFYSKKLVDLAIDCGYQKCFVSSHGVYDSGSLTIHRNSINKTMGLCDIDAILNCSIGIRLKWKFEDIIKHFLKNFFGVKFYTYLRKAVLE